jgi:sugar/nucleoside kinase (ribokinase family)
MTVLPRARYLFIGAEEASTVFGLQGTPQATLEALARLAPKATIALMQGADGCTVLDGGKFLRPRYRHAVEVVDPIGAGDALFGTFLAYFPAGDLRIATEQGLRAAVACVGLFGDALVDDPWDAAESGGVVR